MSRIPPLVAEEVKARAAGYCEACGWPLASEGGVFHHRKLRSAGGRDETVNLMEVHPRCHNGHTNSIHSRVQRSQRLHHIVKMGEEPADTVPIVEVNLLRVIW